MRRANDSCGAKTICYFLTSDSHVSCKYRYNEWFYLYHGSITWNLPDRRHVLAQINDDAFHTCISSLKSLKLDKDRRIVVVNFIW